MQDAVCAVMDGEGMIFHLRTTRQSNTSCVSNHM